VAERGGKRRPRKGAKVFGIFLIKKKPRRAIDPAWYFRKVSTKNDEMLHVPVLSSSSNGSATIVRPKAEHEWIRASGA